MLPCPTRTLVAVLATLAMIGAMTAIPVAAQTDTPACATTTAAVTEEVTDDVTLAYDADFACTDAAASGTWSISVTVENQSETDVSIDSISLSHTSPPFGDEDSSTADAGDSLPLTVDVGETGTFEVGGTYALVDTADGSLVNLHLQAAGTTLDDESAPFVLGINVHVLGPGVELDEDENGEGRPSWVPGPPPWVIDLLMAIFTDGFPWGTDTFPPGDDAAESGTDADAGPPAGLQLPPQAAGGGGDADETGDDDGPPSWVRPGGPPAEVPGPPEGAGRP